MKETIKPDDKDRPAESGTYEAPAIEEVVTAEALEREVHYAGFSA